MKPNEMRRDIALGLISKIGIPLLLGLITIVAASAAGVAARSALELAGAITLGSMLVLFFIDFEIRLSGLHEHLAAGFQRKEKAAQLLNQVERSVLDTSLLTDFLAAAGAADGNTNISPMMRRLARREIERATWFVRQLPVGSEIAYDGEDREWLLGLTAEAERSIDAISLSTVDAGLRGFDGGLWTSDLGHRYLDSQRDAIKRQVTIRRIFVFENEDLARDETFLKITQMQRDVGVDVRMLDQQLIPEGLQSMIFDFIVFDGIIGYESTPAATFTAGRIRPAFVRTLLAPMPARAHDLQYRFEQLWAAADPERAIDS
jgi:hypothetical protein